MPASPPTFDLEHLRGQHGPVAGVDEAGRGPWAGPVVAAAVILDPQAPPLPSLGDSKTLRPEQRTRLAVQIRQSARAVAIGSASVAEIDSLNILRATFLAMQRAISALDLSPGFALIDGNRLPPGLPCPAQAIIKGDACCASIAAASIIAKTWRDALMAQLATSHPAYGWETNAGYGTAHHQRALADHGVTPHHRRSFRPIATLIAGQ